MAEFANRYVMMGRGALEPTSSGFQARTLCSTTEHGTAAWAAPVLLVRDIDPDAVRIRNLALSIVLGATAYAGKQQLTAFVIGVPTITLLVFLVLAEVTPRLIRLTGAFGVSEDDAPQAAEDDAGASPGGMETGSWRRIGIVYGWLLLYFAMTFVFGFYIAIPVFMVLFLTVESRLIPVFAVGVMVAAGLPLYIIFRLVLDIPLWPGILPRIIPGVIGGGIVPQLN